MVHRTLTPAVLMESERRTHVMRDTPAFLQQHDFHPLPVASAPAGIELTQGDRLYIHTTPLFVVLLQLRKKTTNKTRSTVRVGQLGPKGTRWNEPTTHITEYLAVLDACKLAQAFSPLICGGD